MIELITTEIWVSNIAYEDGVLNHDATVENLNSYIDERIQPLITALDDIANEKEASWRDRKSVV